MPRTTKVPYRSNSKAVYLEFCEANPDIDIPFWQWEAILGQFNKSFRDYILETGERPKLPFGFGSFSIAKYQRKKFRVYEGQEYVNLSIDWAKSKKAGKYIYHLNNHTDGKNFRWYWFLGDAHGIQMANIWMFKPNRDTSRSLTAYINRPGRHFDRYKQWRSDK